MVGNTVGIVHPRLKNTPQPYVFKRINQIDHKKIQNVE